MAHKRLECLAFSVWWYVFATVAIVGGVLTKATGPQTKFLKLMFIQFGLLMLVFPLLGSLLDRVMGRRKHG